MKYSISTGAFLERHELNVKRTTLRLKRYLADPCEENIHDLRTAIRRLDASYTVLPKAPRTDKRTKLFVASYKKFFKASGAVRDMDVMILRLEKRKSLPAIDVILQSLRENRDANLQDGEAIAASLERMREPAVNPKKVPADKLQKRLNELILPLLAEIEELLPVVIQSSRLVQELHKLRISCKKLRYLLESIGGGADMLSFLASIQDHLGAVHDSDVMIKFLKEADGENDLAAIIRSEAARRRRLYRKFVLFAKSAGLELGIKK